MSRTDVELVVLHHDPVLSSVAAQARPAQQSAVLKLPAGARGAASLPPPPPPRSSRQSDRAPEIRPARRLSIPPPASEADLAIYKQALRETDNRNGRFAPAALNWRRAGLAFFVLALCSILLNFYQAALPRVVPYAVEIDKIGTPHFHGSVLERADQFVVPPRCIRDHLRRFVENLRRLTADPDMTRLSFQTASKMAAGEAIGQINKYVDMTKP